MEVVEDEGMWKRVVSYSSNLPLTEINKILKNLVSKMLITGRKSVMAFKKKGFLLYNLQPDLSVTDGALYKDQEDF